jgi:hypothetical protein
MNAKYAIAKTVSIGFMLGAAAGSFRGEVELSHSLGLGWEAYTVPFLIDGMAVLGLLGRGREFAASTQRAGLIIAIAMGTLSLACNILAGHTLGQRLYGALIVGVFLASEWYATKLDKAPAPPSVSDELRTKRSEAARKAAVTRKANKAKATRKPRTPKAPANSGEAARMLAAAGVAPISPA